MVITCHVDNPKTDISQRSDFSFQRIPSGFNQGQLYICVVFGIVPFCLPLTLALFSLQSLGANSDNNMAIFDASVFLFTSFTIKYSSNLCFHRLQFSAGFPCGLRYLGSFKIIHFQSVKSHCWHHFMLLVYRIAVHKNNCDWLNKQIVHKPLSRQRHVIEVVG